MSGVYLPCGGNKCVCFCHVNGNHNGAFAHANPCCHTCEKCGEQSVVMCPEELNYLQTPKKGGPHEIHDEE